MFSMAS
jgi:hypothetical protein